MKVQHDEAKDVVYFSFIASDSTRQVRLDRRRIIDYGVDDAVVGVEFIAPSLGLDLGGVPRATEIEREARGRGMAISVPASAV